jgi:hypothetical protein
MCIFSYYIIDQACKITYKLKFVAMYVAVDIYLCFRKIVNILLDFYFWEYKRKPRDPNKKQNKL